jgi:hypothetical protein
MSVRRPSMLLLVAAAALSLGAPSALAAASTAKPCLLVGKGAPWTSKGQKGNTYNVIGVNGASCTIGVTWLKRLSSHKGFGIKGPPGYTCNVIVSLGQCTTKSGGILEFAPHLKK